MKTMITFLVVALSFSFFAAGTNTYAQDDSVAAESDQLEATILQLREQLMKLESERFSEATPRSIVSGDTTEPSSVTSVRSGGGVFDNSQAVDVVSAQLPEQTYFGELTQHVLPYQAALPMATTLPSNASWIEQPMAMPTVAIPSVPEAVTSAVQPVYEAPATACSQPAPVIEQPLVVQQAPAPAPQVPPTVIVNIYQQAPAPQPSFVQPILAPIHGPAPIQVVAPRRGCCLFGRH